MFPSALAAVQAAVETQRELATQDVPVRIGIHVGEVIVEPERLVGDAVNIAARIESFAVPGGVMLSDDAYDQLRNRTDVAVVAARAVQAQERRARRSSCTPYRRTASSSPTGRRSRGRASGSSACRATCPSPSHRCIGRADDVEALVGISREHRVVTITGPGGVGKTRVIVEAGRALAPEFLDGIAFVPLPTSPSRTTSFRPSPRCSTSRRPRNARSATASSPLVAEQKGAAAARQPRADRQAAAPEVARLVDACPELRIVATSRTPLRIAAEWEYPLSPLPSG